MVKRIIFLFTILMLSSCSTAKKVSTTNDYEDSRELLEYSFELYLIAPNYRSLIYLTNEETVMTYNAPEEKILKYFPNILKEMSMAEGKVKKDKTLKFSTDKVAIDYILANLNRNTIFEVGKSSEVSVTEFIIKQN